MLIPLDDLKHGFLYELKSRNLYCGVFNSKDKSFVGIREKFNNRYLDKEYEYDTNPHYGTARAIREIVECPISNLDTNFPTECGNCGSLIKFVYNTSEKKVSDTYPNRWTHVDKEDCGVLKPICKVNKELFDWLKGYNEDSTRTN